MTPEEQLKLLQESLWYINWSTVFLAVCPIVGVIAIVEAIFDRFGPAFILMVLAYAIWLFGRYLRARSIEYRQRADGIEK